MSTTDSPSSLDFIRARIADDVSSGRVQRVVTRFPPEPNGYLHLGHAMAGNLNFEVAEENAGGVFHLRFDDTNPIKEEHRYAEAIQRDLHWLGLDWGTHLYHASDYFQQLHDFAVGLIEAGRAYVCSLTPDEMRAYRGTLTEPGRDSPHRDRSVEENLDLFRRMKEGEFADGAQVLRAKIDMASPNMNMRDPVLYRILRTAHHRTGEAWCIYPMYDYAHALSDAIEGITHSLCSLEFQDHRPLYDWVVETAGAPCHPQQMEFARLNVGYMVTSKRKLIHLVEQGHVSGWDDPRMPTIAGMRRRGYRPESIRAFCRRAGVSKRDKLMDMASLEQCVRDELNRSAPRVMGVLRPLKVIIENYPEGADDQLEAVNNPEDPGMGTRKVPFSREIYIERDDFMEDPPRKFFRLAPGREVRLRWAYFITCTGVDKDPATGAVTAVRCTYDPATRGGDAPDGRKVKATMHWVSAEHAIRAEVRLFDRLFTVPVPGAGGGEWLDDINPDSLEVLTDCRLEPSLAGAAEGDFVQFERLGYFCVDDDTTPEAPVFNRTATLRDAWAKIEKAQMAGKGTA